VHGLKSEVAVRVTGTHGQDGGEAMGVGHGESSWNS
jgi:hypothetical protein